MSPQKNAVNGSRPESWRPWANALARLAQPSFMPDWQSCRGFWAWRSNRACVGGVPPKVPSAHLQHRDRWCTLVFRVAATRSRPIRRHRRHRNRVRRQAARRRLWPLHRRPQRARQFDQAIHEADRVRADGAHRCGDGAPVGDTTFNNGGATHDMVTNLHEVWVSATQSTNGVAGDTIQKGEALTLRFFQENILGDVNPGAPGGGTERTDPTAKASGVVIKFDGIGSSEDLIVILDLKDAGGNEITRAINVQNSDLIKGNANVPSPYNTEFTLDNNDALLIIEQNDYTVAGETYQLQGLQIMQSANGLTGNAINLNGAVGANGGSSATSNLTAFDPTDNDVLKITDIGFVQQTTGTIPADLDFSFALADADGDQTATQHIPVNVSNEFIH